MNLKALWGEVTGKNTSLYCSLTGRPWGNEISASVTCFPASRTGDVSRGFCCSCWRAFDGDFVACCVFSMVKILRRVFMFRSLKKGSWWCFLWSTVRHSDYSSTTSLGLFCFKSLELPWDSPWLSPRRIFSEHIKELVVLRILFFSLCLDFTSCQSVK